MKKLLLSLLLAGGVNNSFAMQGGGCTAQGRADRDLAQAAAEDPAAKASMIEVYPDAPHAFHADYRPSYREGPA